MSRRDATPSVRKGLVDISNRAQKNGGNPDNVNGWRHEILNKVNSLDNMKIEEFSNQFAPSSKPYRNWTAATKNVFSPLKNEEVLKNEMHMYKHLVTGLNQLCKGMSRDRQLLFVNTHKTDFPPPLSQDTPAHGDLKPDLAALKPGVKTDKAFQDDKEKWKHVSLIVEAKGSKRGDPMTSTSQRAQQDRLQLSKVAGMLMLEQGTLCCFVLGIYGSKARIYRYDHASAIASTVFDYRKDPGFMRRFLWNFVNPKSGLETLGQDDLSSKPTKRDMEEALRRGDTSGKRYIIKESWRQVIRPLEMVFYQRIKEYCDRTNTQMFGVAYLVSGTDLGAREHQLKHRNSERPEQGERSHIRLVLRTVGRPLGTFRYSRQLVLALRDAILGHQLAYKAGVLHRDVSAGNVMIVEGQPFSGFIDDFDYSSLIDSSADGGSPLTDEELESLGSREAELRERTGTFAFLSEALLNISAKSVIHAVHHDLESFYWLLIWVVLRHTQHTHNAGETAFFEVFPGDNEALAKNAKHSFRTREEPLAVKDNPLDMDDWPENDAAIPFSKNTKRESLGDADAAGPSKKIKAEPKDTESEIDGDEFESL
ncbi:hypothetical protein POSPLADRAFT_1046609 [Postia placenta MAD-698-R-SB12]|uniref:Fungal-type protein kinase domain-containing protein n=1 Tax=Postia placenta MAD-698-R-SB12 TaxID=670580 RepID=A0A1X6N0U2_9APHY|nr:hypothetical protein POSPLADRAFT_1046609 [Postia placenta MAD-698-R-SB12]OSX62237.1 hypothetical protein POSPLADRAFT_1046609 [Postia placenta MAD-698-R-SB12]